jgi:tetratricopeptide (TPR) repeat protein
LCVWQSEIARNALSLTGAKADPSTLRELQRWGAIYDRGHDPECRETYESTLKELALVWHKEAQTTTNRESFVYANALYAEYLKRFKNDLGMIFYRAELLYRLGSLDNQSERFCEAAPLYMEVVKLDPSANAKHLKEAAWAAVHSWKACLNLADDPPVETTRHESLAAKPIPEAWQQMLRAFDLYIQYVKDSPELVTIKYRKARVYYEFDHITEAIPVFKDIVDNHRGSELAIYSADLLFDCYALLKRLEDLSRSVDHYCAAPELLRNNGFAQRCGNIRCSLEREVAEQLERANQPRRAGEAYLKIASECASDPRLDEVLNNAAVDFQKARMIGLAVLAFQQLIAARPESSLAKKAVYLVGRNYQDIAAFESAADNYERFAARWPGERDASTALYRASFFRRGLGQSDKAIEDTQLFLRNYGGRGELSEVAAGVAFGEGVIYEQAKDWERLARHLKSYLRDWGARGGIDRQIIANVKLGELAWRAACPVAGVNGACVGIKRPPRVVKPKRGARQTCGNGLSITVDERKPALAREAQARFAEALKLYKNGSVKAPGKDDVERNSRNNEMAFYAAEARMLQGDAEYEKFLQLSVPADLDFTRAGARARFGHWLSAKSRALEKARRAYESTILFKQAHWAIAASARIGQLFQAFGAQLLTTPIPKAPPPPTGQTASGWRELFDGAYCEAFDEQITTFEDKAVGALEVCLQKSTELSWFNEWSRLCETELNQLRPTRYPLANEVRAEPGYVTAWTDRTPVLPLSRSPGD